jgi:hypothetical protein
MSGTIGGHETRLRIEDNKNFLYLSGTFTGAFMYAKTKARSNMLRTDKQQYDYVQYLEWGRWFIKPVILFVKIVFKVFTILFYKTNFF